jgi:hypothetical protein
MEFRRLVHAGRGAAPPLRRIGLDFSENGAHFLDELGRLLDRHTDEAVFVYDDHLFPTPVDSRDAILVFGRPWAKR